MKLFQIIILVFAAVLIAQSDPYGIQELDPDKKKNKGQKMDTIFTNQQGMGSALSIHVLKGEAHNHPLFAVWVEDLSGNYIQTLYVARSVATSVFNYGDPSGGNWTNGVVRRPAALPYWSHKRGVQAEDGLYMPSPQYPIPDAYSGATPKNSSIINTKLDQEGPESFYVLLEINQPWDWNDYWTNNKFPDDDEYKTSSQPAIVYRTLVTLDQGKAKFQMEALGHSHYSGKDGSLVEDLSTLTTALQIIDKVTVVVVE